MNSFLKDKWITHPPTHPQEDGKTITVLDVSGIGMSVGGDTIEFIKKASGVSGTRGDAKRFVFV